MAVKTMFNDMEISTVQNNVVRLTQAQYDALPDTKNRDNKLYIIEDTDNLIPSDEITYDNTVSGLTAANVQDAIDESHLHFECGVKDITRLADSSVYVQITFNKPFNEIPSVMTTMDAELFDDVTHGVRYVTRTSFSIYVRAGNEGNVRIHWQAIGK